MKDYILNKYQKFNPKLYIKDSYTDQRGWNCKISYIISFNNTELRSKLYYLGLKYTTAHDKEIPWCILQSPKSVVKSFMKGLFYGDGSVFLFKSLNKQRFGCAYCSVSENLIDQLQVLLWKLGYLTNKQSRKSKLSKNLQWMLRFDNNYAFNFIKEIGVEKFNNIIQDKDIYLSDIEYKNNTPFSVRVKSVTKLDESEVLYDFTLPKTHSFYGNGFVQHNSHSKEIFENVIAGFAAVESSPHEKVSKSLEEKFNSLFGIENEAPDRLHLSNQIVLSGTAYYHFNHFAEYWEKWKRIVLSQGREDKINEIFPDGVPKGFKWKDYSVIRIPYDVLPDGYMDEGNIARSKATLHRGLFRMEFGACETADTEIITKTGIKRIVDLRIGDEVLTHKNRFRPITKLTQRRYKGQLIRLNTYGYYKDLKFTPDHPFFKNQSFVELNDIKDSLDYAYNQELSNITNIDLKDFTYNYKIIDKYIFPQSSQAEFNQAYIDKIIKDYTNGLSYYEISDKYNIKYSAIWNIIKNYKNKTISKNAIYKNIKLDYKAGLCFGYYASEGSCGKNNVSFALDGHVNQSLRYFIDELTDAIECTFGLKPRHYYKDDICEVTINSRIVKNLFKSICPGICYDKIINHDILFSNKEFIKGFLVGIINGDGHKRGNLITIRLSNKNLINQVKMCLEFLGISSSFYLKTKGKTSIQGRICNLSESYQLDIRSIHYDQAMNILYNQTSSIKRRQNRVNFKDSIIQYDIKNKEYVDYDGWVYNLEVEEDNSYSIQNCTVHNCFSKDSEGFFKASLIESCVANQENLIKKKEGLVNFKARLSGDPRLSYYMGVDTASERDNFAITIQEAREDHRRIVYCWTTNSTEFKRGKKNGDIQETDFFRYCSRKIRDLMSKFNIRYISIDSQGGGRTIYESLHDKDSLKDGEQMLWEIIEPKKSKSSDTEEGLHIVEMVNFRKQEYTSLANHGLKKDFEDKVCLFPEYNPAILGTYYEMNSKFGEEMEDCIENIEELKRELSTIVVTNTSGGAERFDTPEIKLSGSEKVRSKKDRYSALIMSNMKARSDYSLEHDYETQSLEDFSQKAKTTENAFVGPSWLTKRYEDLY